MKETTRLVSIENNHEITAENAPRFWFEYQKSILLALEESGFLTEIQYRYAEEKVQNQLHKFLKKGEGA